MNKEDREVCFKEISSELLDSGKTVNVSTLSENWGVSIKDSVEILEKWLSTFGGDKEFVKQFIVRGTRENGSMFMTLAYEDDLPQILSKLSKKFQMLYSIKLGTEPSALVIPTYLEAKKKRLFLPGSELKRESIQFVPAPDLKPQVKEEKLNASTSAKVTNGSSSSGNNKIASMFKNVKQEAKSPAKESNGKLSPKKKSPAKKEVGKKNGLIGSFFSPKSSQAENGKSANKSVETSKKEKESNEVEVEASSSENSNGKLNGKHHSQDKADESQELSDNPPKRRKVEKGNLKVRAKGSRILVADSDEDEHEDQPESKLVADEPEENLNLGDTKPTAKSVTSGSAEEGSNAGNPVRGKKRRMVTKTYEDEEGFIRTVKESEEYSSSETEDVTAEVKVKKQVEEPSIKPKDKKNTKKSPATPAKPARKPATKQGSIMSFFTKK